MSVKKNRIDRRDFFRTVGAAGLGGVLATSGCEAKEGQAGEPNTPAKQEEKYPQVAKRKLGKTGVEVPMLCLGGMFDIPNNQVQLKKAIDWGVTYWDTANMYGGGQSELGIGKFLANYPEEREKLFIVSKASRAKSIDEVEQKLQESLKRMNTSYIDMYYGVHGCSEPGQLTEELKAWAKSAKERKLIRFFGFSTHTNMEKCIAGAAKLDWIDAIMTTFNFRQMQREEMMSAIDAAHKAGIAIIAMKTQAAGQKFESEQDKKLAGQFLEKGFTAHQANLKAVWSDERICSVCSQMPNTAILVSNVAAALDKTQLSKTDMKFLGEHAKATCNGYCAGCGFICKPMAENGPYISDVMRYLMYYNSYGDKAMARELFAEIPAVIRKKLAKIDYSAAEAACPQNLPIAKLMKEATRKLA